MPHHHFSLVRCWLLDVGG